jgi:uncharacterized membrane protein
MMRNFVRDVGNQITLGVWVATFVYAVLTLGAISGSSTKTFVPDISITVTEVLLIADVVVLIYFIHHIAKSIQLPEVVASIATDLFKAIDAEFPEVVNDSPYPLTSVVTRDDSDDRSVDELCKLLEKQGATVPSGTSGYLQFVGYGQLVGIAENAGAVIRLSHRTGHFVLAGRPLAKVWPPEAATQVAVALDKSHVTGPHRTLIQDPVFAIDQLVEIGIRALSPAVNDTFTALTCIDWISAGLCRISTRKLAEGVYRMINRGVDKIRQASTGMPAVIIRLLDSLTHVIEYTTSSSQRAVIIRQAEMILRAAERDVVEPNDLAQIRDRFEALIAVSEELEATRASSEVRAHQDRKEEGSPSVI